MEFAIPGFVKRFCTPNALFTLNEYLNDYASEKTYKEGKKVLQKEIEKLDEKQKKIVLDGLERINKGDRDVRL